MVTYNRKRRNIKIWCCLKAIVFFCVSQISKWWTSLVFCTLTAVITNPIFSFSVYFLLLSFSVPLTFSITAALQVSISLNKVELSVGESKFFICTGTNATHYRFYVNELYSCVLGSRAEMQQGVLNHCLWSLFVVHMTVNTTQSMLSIWWVTQRWPDPHRDAPALSSLLVIVLSERYINSQP